MSYIMDGRPGRPIKGYVKADQRFEMRVTPGFLKALDELRGDLGRADFMRRLLREESQRRNWGPNK
jgi:hypothetical protein